MLEKVLQYLRNWFVVEIEQGDYAIEGGNITVSFLKEGQYFRIIGSVFNDGVYKYGDKLELTDESFTGAIWGLAIPPDILTIVADIETWQTEYGDITASPYTSESFGGYSYSKASKSSGSDGDTYDWQTAFKSRLAPYRKARETAPVGAYGYKDPPYSAPFNPDWPWR